MTIDADLLMAHLPGLYRDKDVTGDLRRFLEILAGPLAETHASIRRLRDDQTLAACRAEFIPLLGALVGAEVDTTLPERAQRDQVRDAISGYRRKGTADLVRGAAESLTGWRVHLVDFSAHVATLPHVETVNPVHRLRERPVAEQPPGSGDFTFRADGTAGPLFDALTGHPITRAALTGQEATYAGVEGRFTVSRGGVDLFTGPAPWTSLAADLTDPERPRTPAGAPLTLGDRQIAVDPELGRFRIVSPPVLAGDLRVSFHVLEPGHVAARTAPVADPFALTRLGRGDDPVPAVLDMRAPRGVTDTVGRAHFDNLGLFVTPARVATDRRPNSLPPGTDGGRLTFDDRPLDPADARGVRLQLLDGLDGAPLTRAALDGAESLFCGTSRGFAIRIGGLDITDPEFRPVVSVLAADLSDFAAPRRPGGGALPLSATNVAVDPQLGRILLDPVALGVAGRGVRVDYLTAPTARAEDVTATRPPDEPPEVLLCTADGDPAELVDGFDGTPVRTAVRLGVPLSAFHGTDRGWRVARDGVDVTAQLTPGLGDIAAPAPAGRLVIDPDRGLLRFPAGFVTAAHRVSVSFSHSDRVTRARRFDSLARRLPRVLPAGVVPVLIDTRRPSVER
ncbi:phage tail protein [Streptosporangium sp. NPDC002607]